jgi:large subunit ribosomal protein L5
MTRRLKQIYKDRSRAEADEEVLGTRTSCRCRACTKITLNMGVGEAVGNKKDAWRTPWTDMAKISGQKPVVDEGARVGSLVLRFVMVGRLAAKSPCAGRKMYEFCGSSGQYLAAARS